MRNRIPMTARDEMLATYVQANSLGERFAHAMCSGTVGATLFLLSTSDIDTIGQSLLELVKKIEHEFPILYGDPSAPEPPSVLRGVSPITAEKGRLICSAERDGVRCTQRWNHDGPHTGTVSRTVVTWSDAFFTEPEPAPKHSVETATVLQSGQADG